MRKGVHGGKDLWERIQGKGRQIEVDEYTLQYNNLRGVFQGITEPTKPTAPRPLLSLYGIIYVTWYTSGLYQKLPESDYGYPTAKPC